MNGSIYEETSLRQAEDGIRDADVTGVQTCALPICERERGPDRALRALRRGRRRIAAPERRLLARRLQLAVAELRRQARQHATEQRRARGEAPAHVRRGALPTGGADRHLLVEAERPCHAARAAVVHVHAHPLREREVAGGIEIRVVARRERESPALTPEAVEAGRPELVGERGAAGGPVVARREGAPIRDVQIGEAAEQLPEGRADTEQLGAESRRTQAEGEVEPALVAERRRQMEAAGGVPHVAHRRAPVGVAREAEGGGETGARAQPRGEPGRRADGGGHRALGFVAHIPAPHGAAVLSPEAAPGGTGSVVVE